MQGLRDLARLLTDLEHVQGAGRASSTDVGAACVSNQSSRPAERHNARDQHTRAATRSTRNRSRSSTVPQTSTVRSSSAAAALRTSRPTRASTSCDEPHRLRLTQPTGIQNHSRMTVDGAGERPINCRVFPVRCRVGTVDTRSPTAPCAAPQGWGPSVDAGPQAGPGNSSGAGWLGPLLVRLVVEHWAPEWSERAGYAAQAVMQAWKRRRLPRHRY